MPGTKRRVKLKWNSFDPFLDWEAILTRVLETALISSVPHTGVGLPVSSTAMAQPDSFEPRTSLLETLICSLNRGPLSSSPGMM